MKISTLITASSLVPSAVSLSILVPLYIYPTSTAWDLVYSAVANHPSVTFEIIINPASGPGAPPYPNTDYATGISKLNSYRNVFTLGYVHTSYGSRPYKDVIADINVYANWASYTAANISMAGIFFDEAPNLATTANITYVKNASAVAYATVPSTVTPVVFNPGVVPPDRFFYYADTILDFENHYSNYQNQTTINNIPSARRPQSAIVLHNTPTDADLVSLTHTMKLNGIGACYFSNDTDYNSNLLLLGPLADAVAAA